jgi:DNA-binding IscR family transcriptional regulator
MTDPFDAELAALVDAVASAPGGRATLNIVAARMNVPNARLVRLLREAERAGLIRSAVTLESERGRDRVYWLTPDKGHRMLGDVGHSAPDAGHSGHTLA